MKGKKKEQKRETNQRGMGDRNGKPASILPIRLTSDLAFKAVFGREREECKLPLISLLNAILRESTRRSGGSYDDPITELEYVNPFNLQEHAGDKLSCMDIVVRMKSGERIDIEMQVRKQDFLPKRSLYYGARQLTDTLNEGEAFDQLKKCVVISIMVEPLFETAEQFHHIYRLLEIERKTELTDTLELQYIELAKLDLNKPVEEMTEIERWGAYLRSAGEPGYSQLIGQLKGTDGGIEMAETVRIKVSEDERLRTEAMMEDKFQRTILSEIHEARRKGLEMGLEEGREKGREEGREKGREEGREEGREKGREEGLLAAAENMLKEGIPVEIVQKVTGIEDRRLMKLGEGPDCEKD